MKVNALIDLINSWVEIIKSIKSLLGLLALIVVIVGSVIIIKDDQSVTFIGILLLFLISIFSMIYAIKNESLFPTEIKSIWSKNDLPIEENERGSWLGKWNCRWTFRAKDNQLKPYVDDIIEIKEVDYKSGELTGVGYSSYVEGSEYYFKGRISNKRVAHMFYTSPAESAGLSGMVILSRPPIGEITGWWIGAGRKGGDIGGSVTMERHENNPDFEIKYYEIS